MNSYKLRYQFALFGNYEEIMPSASTIEYFLKEFSDKGLLPTQYNEVKIVGEHETVNIPRLQFVSFEKGIQIIFSSDRIDIYLTNINIGKFEMPDSNEFIQDVLSFLTKVNLRFPRLHKRLGFVTRTATIDADLTLLSDRAVNKPEIFKDKAVLEWSNKVLVRDTIEIPEIEPLNLSVESVWQKANMTVDGKAILVDGLLTIVDINTLNDNQNYRFNIDKVQHFLEKAIVLESNIIDDQYKVFNVKN